MYNSKFNDEKPLSRKETFEIFFFSSIFVLLLLEKYKRQDILQINYKLKTSILQKILFSQLLNIDLLCGEMAMKNVKVVRVGRAALRENKVKPFQPDLSVEIFPKDHQVYLTSILGHVWDHLNLVHQYRKFNC